MAVLLVACGTSAGPSEGERAADTAYQREPWNSPAREAAAQLQTAPTHAYKDGIALSPDGRTVAFALARQPRNEIALVDLATKRVTTLRHPSRQVLLTEIAFHPRGRSLVFVVTPRSLFGISEIVEVDLDGRQVARYGEHSSSYRHPVFSPDGRRLAFMKDATGRVSSIGVRPEYMDYRAWSVHEQVLDAGPEVQLDPRAWSVLCGLFYDPRTGDLYVCGGLQRSSTNPYALASLSAGMGVHSVRMSARASSRPTFEHSQLGYASPAAILSDGSTVLLGQVTRGVTQAYRVAPGGHIESIGLAGVSLHQAAVTPDGRFLTATGRFLEAPVLSQDLFISGPGGRPERVPFETFSNRVVLLSEYGRANPE